MRGPHRRSGSMRWGLNAFLVSALALAGLIALLWKSRPAIDRSPVFVYCAAGLRGPVEEIAQEYEKEYGIKVQLTYGPSETLIGNARASGTGDLILPADSSYIEQGRLLDLVDESLPIATMKLVVAVKKGNPKKIHTLNDLFRKDVRIALGDEAAAVGRMTRKALQETGRWEELKKKSVFKGTVPLVATDVRLGEVDAGIVWDATVVQFQKHLEGVAIRELQTLREKSTSKEKPILGQVEVGVLRSTRSPAAALRFARYLSASDRGLSIFSKHGVTTIPDGDDWADGDPIITMKIGAMIQPAVKQTLIDFANREGLTPSNIRIKYNGCGILVGEMKAGERPDAFFACDAKYLDDPLRKDDPDGEKVKDLFLDSTEISKNRLVILVHKGNPKNIQSIRHLTRKGIRVGVGHEHKCAMGALTAETFRKGNVKGQVHVVIEAATGDELVNKMVAAPDEMDAAVVYVSNAKRVANRFDTIDIDLECAIAAQPIAVGRESRHKYLVGRLVQMLTSAESKKRFEENGFQWQGKR